MSIIKWAESVVKKFKWYDIKLAQLAAISFVLMLITVWPEFLELVLRVSWYWYLIAAFVFGLPLVKRMFFY